MLLVSVSAVVKALIDYASAIEQPARVVTIRISEELQHWNSASKCGTQRYSRRKHSIVDGTREQCLSWFEHSKHHQMTSHKGLLLFTGQQEVVECSMSYVTHHPKLVLLLMLIVVSCRACHD